MTGTVWLCHDCLSCNDAAKTFCLKVKAKGSKTKPKPKAKVEETVTVEEKEDVDQVENPPPRILPNKIRIRSTGRGTVPTAGLDTEWLTVLVVSNPTPAHASNT